MKIIIEKTHNNRKEEICEGISLIDKKGNNYEISLCNDSGIFINSPNGRLSIDLNLSTNITVKSLK